MRRARGDLRPREEGDAAGSTDVAAPARRHRKGRPARGQLRRSPPLCPAVLVLAVALAAPAAAERAAQLPAPDDPAGLCEAAAAAAARETGVPLAVLRAISLTETGRRQNGAFRPWPWTVNMEGAGKWFDSAGEAQDYARTHHARGARSFDVGCFQLNFRWHGRGFASLDEMFDPLANARYAARFLADLHAETGDWSSAAGAYHSRTPHYAQRYRARFDRILAQLDGAPPVIAALPPSFAPAPPMAEAAPRVNSFPLLQASAAAGGLGSLVPLAPAAARRFIDTGPDAETAADDAG